MMWGGYGQGGKTDVSTVALNPDLQHPLWHMSQAWGYLFRGDSHRPCSSELCAPDPQKHGMGLKEALLMA